jgi:hypothetical protein
MFGQVQGGASKSRNAFRVQCFDARGQHGWALDFRFPWRSGCRNAGAFTNLDIWRMSALCADRKRRDGGNARMTRSGH